MERTWEIRAEFRDGTHRDVLVCAEDAFAARRRAEDSLGRHDFTWRGFVVFVGFAPAV